ncbi:MAG: hypothetical protein O2901_15905 [Verrucomicrobia bacterium]|nr:hypothetical protein [Verrucomicrobiota bacterium]
MGNVNIGFDQHVTLGIPKMLRPYFPYDRDLLKDLCRIAHKCLLEYLRATSTGRTVGNGVLLRQAAHGQDMR